MKSRPVIRLPVVKGKTTLSKSALYRLEAAGKFPKRVRLGENSTGWYEDEIDEWLASRPRVADVAKAK